MKLYCSTRSPYVRKVLVVAHEAGLLSRIELERVVTGVIKINEDLMGINPLNKIPTLITDDGFSLFDSRVICEYLDSLSVKRRLFPADSKTRFHALRNMSLGDGLTDLMMSRLMESLRPAERQSIPHRDAYVTKCNAALAALEAQAPQLNHEAPTIGEIAIASALAFADFRFATDNWRHGRETLAVWFAQISERASMKETAHVDQY